MTPVILSKSSPQVLCFLKSMHSHGLAPGFVCILGLREKKPRSRYMKHVLFLYQEELFTEKGIRRIKGFLDTLGPVGMVSIQEKISFWLWDNHHILGENCRLLLPGKEELGNVLSKKKQVAVARETGLLNLPTYYITKDPESYAEIPLSDFPICLRPSAPGAVTPYFKVKMVSDRKTLDIFVKNTVAIDKSIIAQPFLNLPNLVVHGSRTVNGDTLGMQGFIVDRKFQGLTLTIKPFDLPRNLAERCMEFTRLMQIQGPYHFEFLYDAQKRLAWFLELNNRLGGTTAKVVALGYDEPGFLLKAFGLDLKISNTLASRTASSKMALLKYLYYALTKRLTPLDFPAEENVVTRVLQTVKAFLLCRDDILSLNDPQGSLFFYLGSLRGKFVP